VVTLAIWGAVTPVAILTKCGLSEDMVDVITYAIFGDCQLRGVGVVTGVSLPSPIDLTRRPYNTGHMCTYLFFFMAALFSGPGERRFAKVLHVVYLECH